ncbi:MAG: redoxin domain-containing protein [Chloroflexota bacterium]|nr:redoxin domain-containing protein [Chloroflexota bacterium]MDE2941459.1 redoxin domain-containing protein [Chloroflexota bacterium]MDE3268540.1 redoxin domain-containing protein [Chloroflexota bacterium]
MRTSSVYRARTGRTASAATLIALLAAVVLLAAACGGDPATTPAPTATPAEQQQQAATDPAPTTEQTDSDTPTSEVPDATAQEPATEPEATQDPSQPSPTPEPRAVADGPTAPQLAGITGWINTEPFNLDELRGQVVLIDFWTYTCVNCIRTLPFLKEWHDKYADLGLVIVGVHSPEFEFEKVMENVEAAAVDYGLKYPIVQDNDFQTWRAYNNRAWPAKYLIDRDGIVRYSHIGEGAYTETEKRIRELLVETGAKVYNIPVGGVVRPDRDPKATGGIETGQTRELYAGEYRNRGTTPYVGNIEYYSADVGAPFLYQDPGDHRNHLLYLHGLWTKELENVTHARTTENLEDYIGLRFNGTTVNVVINFEDGEPFKVVATLDDQPIPEGYGGADIMHDENGMSYFLVDEPRMYRVVELPEYNGLELKLSSNSEDFSVFAFTFGSYVEGP